MQRKAIVGGHSSFLIFIKNKKLMEINLIIFLKENEIPFVNNFFLIT